MVVGGSFLVLFIWASKSGQFDDTVTPSMRMLFDNNKKVAESKDEVSSDRESK